MTVETVEKIADFIFERAKPGETNYIAFFGGEPMLEFDLLQKAVCIIEGHPRFNEFQFELSIVTNGTIFTDDMADFLKAHEITYCLSCDGDATAQDLSRRFKNGAATSDIVEATIKKALAKLPHVLVNAVFSPETLSSLPDTVRYFLNLGLTQIYLNANYTAKWRPEDAAALEPIFREIADIYIDCSLRGKSVFISSIDEKLAVILRGGYSPSDKCHMGKKEFAFSPEGNVFPCERILDDGSADSRHCIGNVETGIDLSRLSCNMRESGEINTECMTCGIRKYCMNWCGCTNFQSTGYYNRAGAFLCAEEKTLVKTAMYLFEALDGLAPETSAS